MRKCSYCGREFPDETTHCPTDGERLSGVSRTARQVAQPQPVNLQNASEDGIAELLRQHGKKEMVTGALWCGGGILVTFLTYSAASGPQGGTYLLAWGPIIFGGIRFFRGLMRQ